MGVRGTAIVVGAGPVGLCAATALGYAGLDVTVFEAAPSTSREWRASTFHPPTLEHLERFGVVDEMLAQGLVANRYQIRDRRRGLVADFDYSTVAGDTRYPFRLQLEQYKLADMLHRRLRDTGRGRVLVGHRVTGLRQDESGVDVHVETPDGDLEARADYVIGADGASSTVRGLLGCSFDGWTYEQRFLLISTDLSFEDYIADLCRVNYIADPREFVMLLRIPDIWRVLVPVPAEVDDEAAADVTRMRGIIEGIVGTAVDWDRTRVPQRQLYRVHQRVADRFRVGRVMLVGDAAHVNSPLGGFGLNSGLHDALDLAVRLERIATEGRRATRHGPGDPEAELVAFDRVRRAVAVEHIQRRSHDNTRTLIEAEDEVRTADLERLARIAADRDLTRDWLLDASMISAVREHGIGLEPRDGTRQTA